MRLSTLTTLTLVLSITGCGGDGPGGGASGMAGVGGTGGSGGIGGSAGNGGVAGQAGNAGMGGSAGTGGASGSAGAAGMGGSTGTGGASGSAGAAGMGGSAGTGGASGSAGAAGAGGASGSGGSGPTAADWECCGDGYESVGGTCKPKGITCGATRCEDRAHTAATCNGGTCNYTCDSGWDDCDGDPSNGCEASLLVGARCGSCTTKCEAGELCSESAGCVAACSPPETQCSSRCVNLTASPSRCGGCSASNACADKPHSTPVCTGSCDNQCDDGYTKCGGNCVDTTADTANCGGCGLPCTAPSGGLAKCSGSACSKLCPPGQQLCGNECADTLRNNSHCGGCNQPCAGQCVNGTCDASYDSLVLPGVTAEYLVYEQGNLYWIEGNDIKSAPEAGGAVSTVIANQETPKYLVAESGYLYYIATLGGAVYRVPTSGGSRELVSAASQGSELAVGAGYALWTQPPQTGFGPIVYRAPITGGSSEEFFTTTLGTALRGIAVDGNDAVIMVSAGPIWTKSLVTGQEQEISSNIIGVGLTSSKRVAYLTNRSGTGSGGSLEAINLGTGAKRELDKRTQFPAIATGVSDTPWNYFGASGPFAGGVVPPRAFYRVHSCGFPAEQLYSESSNDTNLIEHPALGPDFVYFATPAGVRRVPR
ncbi:MAG: hypothetical protein H6718_34490 [Polyangiaceae bacterium]|nr:hypothetical protein [Polyangiaceae bacterium]